MFDDINAYFHENIWSTYTTYLKTRKSRSTGLSEGLRSSINLASVLYHLREHIPTDKQKSKKEITSLCPDYRLLGDIVNVSKHKTIKNHEPLVSDAENIYEQIVTTEYRDEQGIFNHIEKTVCVKLDDGTERDLHEVIINVLNMWLVELNNLGLIGKIKPIHARSNRLPVRSSKSWQLNMKAIQGVRFTQQMKMQRFNYEKRCIEPIDLTGAEIVMNIYEKKYDVVLMIENSNTGQSTELNISVNEKQKKKLEKITDKKEFLVNFMKLAKEQGKIADFNFKGKAPNNNE